MVYYRKYRPQTIDDLDSKTIRETLISVLSSTPAHAFLFTGPKGLGKTSTARIIAKAVNCTGRLANKEQRTKNKELKSSKSSVQSSELVAEAAIEPCNKCEQCISITNGTNMDILEIDAASNRGIDEIRDLKEKIRLSPLSAKMKVYIIDEVHMLTTEAFNALLKTLEEPPMHAMFILCTTEPQKVPATIISRCVHISFVPATEEELMRSFKRIIKGEKLEVDDKALTAIAGLSEGGFRDGAKILEEFAQLSKGKKITKELIEAKYQVNSISKSVIDLKNILMNDKGLKTALSMISEIKEQGIDIKYFIQQLIEQLHGDLLTQIENNQTDNLQNTKYLLDLLTRAYGEMKYAVIQQLPLELAIIEFLLHSNNNQAQSDPNISASAFDTTDTTSINSLRKQVGNIKKNDAMFGSSKKTSVVKEIDPEKSAVGLLNTVGQGEITKEWIDLFWNNIITEMKNYNHTIAGVLRGCHIRSYDKKNLIIETAFKFHKERLDDIKTQLELARVCKLLTGREVAVVVELKGR